MRACLEKKTVLLCYIRFKRHAQIENGNIANQIYGFTIDYGKFILIGNIKWF